MSARPEASRLHKAGQFHSPKACIECQGIDIARALRAKLGEPQPGQPDPVAEAIRRASTRIREEAKRLRPTGPARAHFRPEGGDWIDLGEVTAIHAEEPDPATEATYIAPPRWQTGAAFTFKIADPDPFKHLNNVS
jgi:hypothetical protein